MPFLETSSGATIHYTDTGSGLPVMLIHGWAMSGRVWNFQHPLAERFRLIVVDLRGHGRSSEPPVPLALADLAADVAQLCDHLDVQDGVVVGWSLGSQVALRLYSLCSSRIRGMVIVGGTPRFVAEGEYEAGLPLREVRGLEVRLARNYSGALGDFFRRMFIEGELSQDQENRIAREIVMGARLPDPQVARQGLAILVEEDLRPLLPEIGCPVSLIHGAGDTICPLPAAEMMARLLPRNRLHVIQGCGHAPFLSFPGDFNRLLEDETRRIHELH